MLLHNYANDVYDFDEAVDRRGTSSLKWDFAAERGKPEGLLPLWVADMDFRAPRCVLDALQKAAEHGIFGYSEVKGGYFEAVREWFVSRYGFETRREWLLKTPGVVTALATAVRALTRPGECIIIQPPVYYPFRQVVVDNGRKLAVNPLVYADGRYLVDFEDFEAKVIRNNVKLFILCNPHNPVGRVWTRDELVQMAEICRKHGVVVVSDEIHCDFVWRPYTFTPFGTLGDEYLCNCIICTAPSKSFNLAGLQVANIFIPNEGLRSRFMAEICGSGYSQLGVMGLVAGQAAYENGAGWLAALREYLCKNIDYVRGFIEENIGALRVVEPEGTYLVWVGCSGLGLKNGELARFFEDRAGLWIDEGTMFGEEGGGFIRFNVACPRSTLETACLRLKKAVDGL